MYTERGFTLIELMMVIAILAIIIAIAIPSYTNQVEKTRRADAVSSLLNAAQLLERCFTRTNTYQGCAVPEQSQDGYYNISVTAPEGGTLTSEYLLTANAISTGPQSNDACSPFTLNHRGIKQANSDTDRCWGN